MFIFVPMKLKELFDNSTVRRQDRLLDYDKAKDLLTNAEYGFLSFGGESGYGIPINFALNGTSIYFHCASQGEKLQRVVKNNNVCFCVVGNTEPQPEKFSTAYESVLSYGQISIVSDDDEKMAALGFIVDKYSPGYKELGKIYAEKSFDRTVVMRLDIVKISGKAKVIPKSL